MISVQSLTKLIHSVSAHAIVQSPIVFIFYDAGTTKAFEPVMDKLDKKKINYSIIAFGTARALLVNHPNYIDVNSRLAVTTIVDRENWQREKPLGKEDADRIQKAITCQLVVVGTSSIIEAQLAKMLQNKGIKVVAYFDGFQSPELEPELNRAFLKSVDEIIVPCQTAAAGFCQLQLSSKVLILGQPTLDIWSRYNTRANIDSFRQKLSSLPSQSLLLYAGGYGEGYEESFRLFIEAAKQIKNYRIIVSLHPKVLGNTEKHIMQEMAAQNLQILPKDVLTVEAAVASDVIVSQCSTVGVQARFIGKQIIYLDSRKGRYTNIIIEKKLAFQVHDVNTFLKVLDNAANDQNFIPEDQLYQKAGIVPNATDNILSYLEKSLKETQKIYADGQTNVHAAVSANAHKNKERTGANASSQNSSWLPFYSAAVSRAGLGPNNIPCVAPNSEAQFPNLNRFYHCCNTF